MKKTSFSLVELLIVIAILAVLVSLVTPAMSSMSYKATLMDCQFHLKNIGTGLVLYAEDHDEWYPRKSDMLGRLRYTDVPNEYGSLSSYYSSSIYGDKRDLQTRYSDLWTCPQANIEPIVESVSYIANNSSYDLYSDCYNGIKTGPYDYVPDMMRRLGDTFRANTNITHTEITEKTLFNILASDILYGKGIHNQGRLQTNHIKGGNRETNSHFSAQPNKWYSLDGVGTVNYLFDDLSIKILEPVIRYDPTRWQDILHLEDWVIHLPKEFGIETQSVFISK
jgi:prepilin-type N-terminal cleavage/methylation domain-containing protein